MMEQNKAYIERKIEILDSEICSKCTYFEVEQNPSCTIVYAEGKEYARLVEPLLYCRNKEMCEYLQKLFASKSTPKVEESESDP